MSDRTAEIERELEQMTSWDGEKTSLWSKALEQAKAETPARARPIVASGALAALAAVLVIAVTLSIMLPSLGKARSVAPSAAAPAEPPLPQWASPTRKGGLDSSSVTKDPSGFNATQRNFDLGDDPWIVSRLHDDSVAPERLVVRKATIDLTVEDLESSVVRAKQLISEATGEYVESADVSPGETARRAQLILRVRADRLEEVLSALRRLGEIRAEQVSGEDVTDQAVDLDARLSNEHRVEQELLALLDARGRDVLGDVLELRRSLNEVRLNIERLTAQRDKLSRLASLATIAVLLHEDLTEPDAVPDQGSLWNRFTDDLSVAWSDGLGSLASWIVWMVRTVVGGLPWFVVFGGASALAWRAYRVHHPRPLST